MEDETLENIRICHVVTGHCTLTLQSNDIKEDMDFLAELFEAGKVVPVIDRRYTLSEVPEALQYLEEGQALGKLVISVENTT